jgi:hypothetical protein
MTFSAGVSEEVFESKRQSTIKTQNAPTSLQNTLPTSQSPSSDNICIEMDNFENRNFSSFKENDSDFIPYSNNNFNFDILPYEKEVKADERLYSGAFNWNFDDYFSI